RFEMAQFAVQARELGVDYIGICCGAGPHHVRAMAEALGREVPASRYSPSMELHPMFRPDVSSRDAAFLDSWSGGGLGAQAQKSMLASGSAVAPQNSTILPSRVWLTLATRASIDLPPREAVSVHRATVCSSLARMSWTSSRNVPPVSSASLPKKPKTSFRPW